MRAFRIKRTLVYCMSCDKMKTVYKTVRATYPRKQKKKREKKQPCAGVQCTMYGNIVMAHG